MLRRVAARADITQFSMNVAQFMPQPRVEVQHKQRGNHSASGDNGTNDNSRTRVLANPFPTLPCTLKNSRQSLRGKASAFEQRVLSLTKGFKNHFLLRFPCFFTVARLIMKCDKPFLSRNFQPINTASKYGVLLPHNA